MSGNGISNSNCGSKANGIGYEIVDVCGVRAESEVKAQGKPSTGILTRITNKFKSMVGYTGSKRKVTAGPSANATSIAGGAQKAETTKITDTAASTEKFGNFDYGKFKGMSEDEKKAFITKISKKFSREKARLLGNIEKAISQHPEDADLRVLKLIITGDKGVLIDFYSKCYDDFNKSIEGIRDKALNGQLDEAGKNCFKKGWDILYRDCLAFMEAYVKLGGKNQSMGRAFIQYPMIQADMEKPKNVAKPEFIGEVLNKLEAIKERLELEKYAEQFLPGTSIDEQLKNLLGETKGISAVQEWSVLYELKVLKYISENKDATEVGVLLNVFPLNGFAKEDAENFLSSIKNTKIQGKFTALSLALRDIWDMKSKECISDGEIVECIKDFSADSSATRLTDVWTKRKIEEKTGLKFETGQSLKLRGKLKGLGMRSDYQGVIEFINKFKESKKIDEKVLQKTNS